MANRKPDEASSFRSVNQLRNSVAKGRPSWAPFLFACSKYNLKILNL